MQYDSAPRVDALLRISVGVGFGMLLLGSWAMWLMS